MIKTLVAAAALSAALTTAPAVASDDQKSTVSVTYDDLNLSTEKGQKALEARFAKAVREVCEADQQRTGSRVRSIEVQRCLAEAKKSTKAAMARILSDNQLGG